MQPCMTTALFSSRQAIQESLENQCRRQTVKALLVLSHFLAVSMHHARGLNRGQPFVHFMYRAGEDSSQPFNEPIHLLALAALFP